MGQYVIPNPDSYVLEWEAVQVCGADCFTNVRRLLSGSPWVARLILTDDGVLIECSQITSNGIQQWNLAVGEWVIKSPHGRYWFMSEAEFASQFTVES